MVSYVAFVLSLVVPYLSFFWCLGRAVLHDCGSLLGIIPYIFASLQNIVERVQRIATYETAKIIDLYKSPT